MASKYAALTKHLNTLSEPVVEITFDEIDVIVDGIPLSARRHNAWWANSEKAHDHARSWLEAGRRATPRFDEGLVRFEVLNDVRRKKAKRDSDDFVDFPNNEVSLDGRPNVSSPRKKFGLSFGRSSLGAPRKKRLNTKGLEEITSRGFLRVCAIDIKRDSGGEPLEYLPQDRYDNPAGYKLNLHGEGPFCQFELPKLTDSAGVYAIVVGEEVVYIGECQNLSERYGPRGYGVVHPRNCFVGGQSTNCKINSRVLSLIKQELIPALFFVKEAGVHRKDIERDLVDLLEPSWNGRSS